MLLSRRALLGSAFAAIFGAPARAGAFRVLPVRKASLRLLPEFETAVYGFDGQAPGPLLRCKQGEALNVRLLNDTDQPLSFACQGMRLDNAMDGVAGLTQAPILPGQSFDYPLRPPDPGFFFYRSLVAPREQVRSGLYGPIIVDEPDPPTVDRDMAVLLADWRLDGRGQIFGDSVAPAAVADTPRLLTTVNSNSYPVTEALSCGARVRLRLLNAASTRIMFVAFDGINPMVLAIDSVPCGAFAPLQNMLPIGPGARFDVMFDLPAEPGDARLLLRNPGAPDQPLLIFRRERGSAKKLPPIASLPPNPRLPAGINLKAARKLDLVLGGGAPDPGPADPPDPFRLNGLPAEEFGQKPFFSVPRGMPVSLGFVNKTAFAAQFHVHGHHLRVLHDLDDGWEPYWRDSVVVAEARTKHVAFLADNPGKWAIECLPLYLQSSELVTWFEVT